MKIRIMGLPGEVIPVIKALVDAEGLEVIEVSDSYPNRGDSRMVRVYIEAQPRSATEAVS
jgi:hypothetical protein